MKIITGKTAGFCYGVKRAVDGANEAVKKSDKKTYCLGEIVHNNEVIKDLENKGIKFVDNITNAEGTTIIRAHGVPKDVYELAKRKNVKIEDYTCPMVIKIHKIAEEYAKNGYFIILTGSKNHPENIGTMSYCGKNYYVIEKEEDVLDAIDKYENYKNESKINKMLLISQTTYSLEKFEKIEKKIKELLNNKNSNNEEIVIKNTICASTKVRQKETEQIAKQVDFMIIIGGKNSSNTKKLFEIASKNCQKCVCIENETELDLDEIKQITVVGIMAGASTPEKSINNVVKKLEKII